MITRVLKTGVSAYYDSLSGMVPCKVLSIGPTRFSEMLTVSAVVTRATRTYPRGTIINSFAHWFFPRNALLRRKYRFRVAPHTVIAD